VGTKPRPIEFSDLSHLRRAQSCGLEVLIAPLRVEDLGIIDYKAAHQIQEELWARSGESWLLLLEHHAVYTQGVQIRPENILISTDDLDIPIVSTNRGGDVTYHGPGQLVAYVIVDVEVRKGAVADHVCALEQIVIDTLNDVGLTGATRTAGLPGVWIDDAKIAAVGVRIARGRSMHGVALNINPDLTRFDAIVPCGITDKSVTSMAAEGITTNVAVLRERIIQRVADRWTAGRYEERYAGRYEE